MNKNQTSLEILEHNKRCNILFFEEKSVWEGYLGQREDFLTSNYWKNWREKIKNFQSQNEMDFYVDRLSALMDFIYQSVADKGWVNNKLDPRVKKEEERLENISEKEWKKEDKFVDYELREVSVKEALNDPWFSKEIDKFFGLENGKLPKEKLIEKDNDSNVDYKTWTKDRLISEINSLKVEIEQLKNNQILTSSERQERLQKSQQKLEEFNSYYNSGYQSKSSSQPNTFNYKFSTSLILGGVVLLAIGGLLTALIYKNKKNKK